MLKKLAMICAALLIAAPAFAQDEAENEPGGIQTIGGSAFSVGVDGPLKGEVIAHFWVGSVLKTWKAYRVKFYAAAHYAELKDIEYGGLGGEGYFVAQTDWPDWYGLIGGTWLPDVDAGEDAWTVNIGIAYAFSDVLTGLVVLDWTPGDGANYTNLRFGFGLDGFAGMLTSVLE